MSTESHVYSDPDAAGLKASRQVRAWRMPLSFRCETTVAETHFTNTLGPNPWGRVKLRPTTINHSMYL
ncbi:hypothetical protein [Sphaerimonospora thailandensis]|uniref:hypothetical protein n=1 Tax=Sphaerimonospora thailandensis TaxID=795644 RepID=UPI00194F6658|nr:hypothetical protein [Sphaerimonospora thailandensis]